MDRKQTGNPKSQGAKKKKNNLIEDLKMEIASELGIMQEVERKGWQSLSPRVSGKIGGLLAQRLKKMDK